MKPLAFASLVAASFISASAAQAAIVTVPIGGTLSSGSGAFSPGQRFDAVFTYDSGVAPTYEDSGYYIFVNPGTFTFGVDGASDTYTNDIYTAITYNPSDHSFGFGAGRASAPPQITFDTSLNRSDPNDVSLPSLAELSGHSGNFNFSYVSVGFASGRGIIGAVPEPSTWALMIGGFGMVGGTMRRRKAIATFANA